MSVFVCAWGFVCGVVCVLLVSWIEGVMGWWCFDGDLDSNNVGDDDNDDDNGMVELRLRVTRATFRAFVSGAVFNRSREQSLVFPLVFFI